MSIFLKKKKIIAEYALLLLAYMQALHTLLHLDGVERAPLSCIIFASFNDYLLYLLQLVWKFLLIHNEGSFVKSEGR